MSWLSKLVRPGFKAFVSNKKDVPDNLWEKCPSCEKMIFHRDLLENKRVCPFCDYHFRVSVEERLKWLFDRGEYEEFDLPVVQSDPLRFRDKKRYTDRIKENQTKTGRKEAIIVAQGTVNGQMAVVAAFDFSFMGGSMGIAVGEGLIYAAEKAVELGAAYITVPSSGGARMQEGMLSLMQMPRSVIAVQMVREAGLPYFTLLTDPTTGGVSASFAMLGDISFAEPGAIIGFAGRRVIEETIREKLPDDFQTAEYLRDHGMLDQVVHRHKLRETFGNLIEMINMPVKQEEAVQNPAGNE